MVWKITWCAIIIHVWHKWNMLSMVLLCAILKYLVLLFNLRLLFVVLSGLGLLLRESKRSLLLGDLFDWVVWFFFLLFGFCICLCFDLRLWGSSLFFSNSIPLKKKKETNLTFNHFINLQRKENSLNLNSIFHDRY